ncbi:MAG TPA: zinc ribbon domain-containing protein [Gemmatimonadales bacterium]|nr:zinc ribbon domain-containing protein [Gemmatimonadales bacterium]
MPTYVYGCAKGHTFEVVQRKTDQPIDRCPECGAAAERRMSGGAGLIFKGSGFYITDYGKDGKGPRKEPAPGGETAPAKPAAGDSPAASAPAKSSGGGSADAG